MADPDSTTAVMIVGIVCGLPMLIDSAVKNQTIELSACEWSWFRLYAGTYSRSICGTICPDTKDGGCSAPVPKRLFRLARLASDENPSAPSL